MDSIYKYNEYYRQEYERTHSITFLEKYVVSETVAPIEDYDNAKRLIREHYREQTNSTLLIIGAHLVQYWGDDHNDFLEILEVMHDYLPKKEQAIISYLKADELRRDFHFDYRNSAEYKQYLQESVAKSKGIPFVQNRVRLAEVSPSEEAAVLLREAISYIDEAFALETDRSNEYYCKPDAFINEFILGTHVPYWRLVELRYKLDRGSV